MDAAKIPEEFSARLEIFWEERNSSKESVIFTAFYTERARFLTLLS